MPSYKMVDGVRKQMSLTEEQEFEASRAPTPPKPQDVRRERDQKLRDSDWTQLLDSPVNQTAWATYRQKLRDLPEQAQFPEDVNWPSKPNS